MADLSHLSSFVIDSAVHQVEAGAMIFMALAC
jgi:hypothetical protein